jgi:hypothetical protein
MSCSHTWSKRYQTADEIPETPAQKASRTTLSRTSGGDRSNQAELLHQQEAGEKSNVRPISILPGLTGIARLSGTRTVSLRGRHPPRPRRLYLTQ